MNKYCILDDVEKIKEIKEIHLNNDMYEAVVNGKKITIFKEDIFESQLEAYMFLRDGLIADLEYVNKKIDSLEEKE